MPGILGLEAATNWKLADAQKRFVEVLNRSVAKTVGAYTRLTGQRQDLKSFLLAPGPDLEGLDLERDRSPMREIEL